MKYIRVNWLHSSPEYPIILYSEIDESGWEVRKVEIYGDGRCGYASESEFGGDSGLGIEPIPDIAEIATDPQFEPVEVTSAEFEDVWSRRHIGLGQQPQP